MSIWFILICMSANMAYFLGIAKSWTREEVTKENMGTSGCFMLFESKRKYVRNGGMGPKRKENAFPVSGSIFGLAVMLMESFPSKSWRPRVSMSPLDVRRME
ncbi:hypothetical protein PS1_011662 [Malus domestica]